MNASISGLAVSSVSSSPLFTTGIGARSFFAGQVRASRFFSAFFESRSDKLHASFYKSEFSFCLSSAIVVSAFAYSTAHLDNSSQALFDSNITINFCRFRYCVSTYRTSFSDYGGAIYVSSQNLTLSAANSLFEQCAAKQCGAALYLNGTSLVANRCCFSLCYWANASSPGWGSGIYCFFVPCANATYLTGSKCPSPDVISEGSVFHFYVNYGYVNNINCSGSRTVYDFGVNIPGATADVTERYILASNSSGGNGIGFQLQGQTNVIDSLSFVNNTISLALIWLRNCNSFAVSNCIVIGSLPAVVYKYSGTISAVTFTNFYSDSAVPINTSYVSNPSDMHWGVSSLTAISINAVSVSDCAASVEFTAAGKLLFIHSLLFSAIILS